MSATAAQIAQLRRMVNEPLTTTYSDATLTTYIETYPMIDARGEHPFTWNLTAVPPAKLDNPEWIDTYDLCAAAANVWEEKAAAVVGSFDFTADGASYSRSQVYEQYMKMARSSASRRSPRTITMRPWPEEVNEDLTYVNIESQGS